MWPLHPDTKGALLSGDRKGPEAVEMGRGERVRQEDGMAKSSGSRPGLMGASVPRASAPSSPRQRPRASEPCPRAPLWLRVCVPQLLCRALAPVG